MSHYCAYCSQLIKADKSHNYCSILGDQILSAETNAFYFKNNSLQSGEHISRLSVRGVLNGYHYYKTGKYDRVVKKDNYLIVNQGQVWQSQIESEAPVEAIVVAYNPKFVSSAMNSLTLSSSELLDNPFEVKKKEVNFFENTYPSDHHIQYLFEQLKTLIVKETKDNLAFEQLYFELFKKIALTHRRSTNLSLVIPAKKAAVKKELFQRLGLAKDYMLAHLEKPLTLTEISKVAALSPYYFLRLFKTVYNTTPHRFLTQERMKRSKYLLEHSSKTIQAVAHETGFENHSAFGRVFKSHFGHTPSKLRKRSI